MPEPRIEGEGGSGGAFGRNRGDFVGNGRIRLSTAQMAPRTILVAPFAAVKSVIIHMTLAAAIGAIG